MEEQYGKVSSSNPGTRETRLTFIRRQKELKAHAVLGGWLEAVKTVFIGKTRMNGVDADEEGVISLRQ